MDSPLVNKFIDAPIFRPGEEEFKIGPANYLRKISKNHPNIPCCIIAPPQSFNPYFSLDQDTFKFKTIKQDFLSNEDVPAEKEFTFREYHRMGDSFKCDYFGKPPNRVPLEEIDENFWTLVSQGEDVQIFSAYRLSTNVYGSGFPTRKPGSFLTKDDEKYLDHTWNFLNIPESEDNIFSFLGNQLRDNTVPTLDIGMCFSHRGWRRDVHWSYSINYLHCGDSKIFYAVSPDDNHLFEAEFDSGSIPLPIDLIGETTATSNSSDALLKASKRKLKVFKAELHPGHFLVTFPSVYYMNYDSGVNVVESVVIAPISWIPIGHKAIEYLCDNKQSPLFSHEEMISKLAIDGELFGIETLNEISTNLELIIYQELSLREVIENYPTCIKRQRQAFELIPEDDRRCSFCGFIIFFSALICNCKTDRFVCLKHIDHLCKKCPPSDKVFRYRYKKEEFEQLIHEIKVKVNNFEKWKTEVNSLLYNWSEQVPITVLRNLYDIAEDKIYPQDCPEYEKLCNALQEFEQVHKIVQELLEQQNKFIEEENSKRVKYQSSLAQSSARIKKKMESEKDENKNGNNPVKSKLVLSRNNESDNENRKLSVFEFSGFCEVLDTYPFKVPGSDELRKLLFRCVEIDKLIDSYLDENTSLKIDSRKLLNLIQDANTISFICFERKLDILKEKLIQIKWLEDCDPFLDRKQNPRCRASNLSDLKSLIESGMDLKAPSNVVTSYLNRLNMIWEEANHWLDKAKDILNAVKQNSSTLNREKLDLDAMAELMDQSAESPGLRAVDLNPVWDELQQLYSLCQQWSNTALEMMTKLRSDKQKDEENIPYASELEDLYNKGKNIGIHFDVLGVMKASLQVANDWKDKVNKTFLRRNSFYPIVNVLAPRSNYSLPSSIDIMNCSSRSIYQQLKKFATQTPAREGSKKLTGFEKQLSGDFSAAKINKIYDLCEKDEMSEIQIIREKNTKKNNQIAFNEFNAADDDTGDGDLNEKDRKSKERDRNSRKFCFCGKPAGDWMVQCQLCQEWYHVSCVSSYLPFVNLVAKGRKQLLIQNSDDVVDQFNFVCILCCRGKRPSIDLVQELIYSYTKLPTRVLEGELLVRLLNRIQRYQEKVKNRIDSHSDLLEGFDIVEKNYCLNSDSSSQEQNITGSPSKNKRKSPLILRKDLTDNHGLRLSNESRTILLELICEGNLLEAGIPEVQHLWNIMLFVNSNLKTLVFVNPNSTSLAILASSTFMIDTNKRTPESDEGNEGEAVETDATKSRNKKRRRDRSVFERSKGKKNRKGKSDKDNNVDAEPELCSLSSECLRPEGQEVDWIFCEGRCQGWFHQLCAGISNPQEVVHLEKYICATCQSLDEIESSNTVTGNGTKDSNLKKTNKAGKSSKNGVKSHIPASTDEALVTTKVFDDGCEQGGDNSVYSKDANLVSDDNAIEIDRIDESNVNGSLDLRDVPRVIADDEETTSVLSEDRVYHETSFESIEESIIENDVGNGSQVYDTYVNNKVHNNVQSSSQTEAILQAEQSMIIEEIPSLTEPTVTSIAVCVEKNGTKEYKKGCVESKEMGPNIVICDAAKLKINCITQQGKQIALGNPETSVHHRQPTNQITNPKES
ncbi:lysine-specific demethylase 5A [Tetranychus urticae]|uniref:lysine-specific demethylase 5A n=1 Tax=Tetranychus urticae TaxID=32264 RepID=UPI00077BAA0A|nr:lysine-specific demethylase 5A [Tetranychus urticae]